MSGRIRTVCWSECLLVSITILKSIELVGLSTNASNLVYNQRKSNAHHKTRLTEPASTSIALSPPVPHYSHLPTPSPIDPLPLCIIEPPLARPLFHPNQNPNSPLHLLLKPLHHPPSQHLPIARLNPAPLRLSHHLAENMVAQGAVVDHLAPRDAAQHPLWHGVTTRLHDVDAR